MAKTGWVLKQAFHPTRFERGVYAVSFKKKGTKGWTDETSRLYQVKSNSRKNAIKKARKLLR